MKSLNEVTILGNLGDAPELAYTKNGIPVSTFSVALNEEWTDDEGKKESRVTWVDCFVWSGLAEAVNEHLVKGSRVLVKGKLVVQSYEKDGVKKRVYKVQGAEVFFLDGVRKSLRGASDSPA